MSYLRFIIGLISIALISSCATNQDLVNLDEVDDIYYQSSPDANFGPVSASSNNSSSPALIDGASDAEKSYYQQTPYSPQAENTDPEPEYIDEDYYDEDYARRLDNFHSEEKQPQYSYGNDDQYYTSQSTSPNINYNINMGYSNYGPGMNWGMGYGYNSFSPYYGMGSSLYLGYGMNSWGYSPYYGGYPYYGSYGGGFGGYYGGYYGGYPGSYWNGYNNGYYNGYYDGSAGYGGGYYGSSSDRWGRQVENVQRPTGSNSTRTSRGGLVNPPGNNNNGGSGIAEQPKSSDAGSRTSSEVQRQRTNLNPTRTGTLSESTSGRSGMTRQTPATYQSTGATRTTRTTVSPYERSQRTTTTRSTNSNTRNTYAPSRSTQTRSTPQNNNINRSRSTPTYSPSRNTNTNTNRSRSSSPSSQPSSPAPSRSRR